MDFLENFVKNLDVLNFVVIIISTIVLTLLFAHYSKICTFSKKQENLVGSSYDDNSDCNCDVPVQIVKKECDLKINKLTNHKSEKYKLNFYYANGCGHCTSFKPEWEKIKNTVNSSNLSNNLELNAVDYIANPESAGSNSELIKGFPTIILNTPNGEAIIYNDYPRTHNSVMNFLKKSMR